jgi:large subunit ribosomal protein L28
MARACSVCGKTRGPGIKYVRKGARKLGGGAGAKIVGKTLRAVHPNLQRIKINVNGTVRRTDVCTSCISAHKVQKA